MTDWKARAEGIVRATNQGGNQQWAADEIRLMARLLAKHNIPAPTPGTRELRADASIDPKRVAFHSS